MRLAVRFLLLEFSLAWVMTLAGFVRAGGQLWHVAPEAAKARLRAWRLWLALLIDVPLAVGWPLLFWLRQAQWGYQGWLPGIAAPWWIVLGGTGLVYGLARNASAESRRELPSPLCRCGTCSTGPPELTLSRSQV